MSEVTTRFKIPRLRSPRHLAWIRTLPCCVPGCRTRPVDAHHVRNGAGVGMKPGDEKCCGLCHKHHDQLHWIGRSTFERNYKVNLTVCAAWLAFLSRCQGRIPG
jgi:hypothetical protein